MDAAHLATTAIVMAAATIMNRAMPVRILLENVDIILATTVPAELISHTASLITATIVQLAHINRTEVKRIASTALMDLPPPKVHLIVNLKTAMRVHT